MQNGLISIIVPVYKAEQFIEDCICSILEQSYRSLEIILVNDGSPDKSGLICDEIAETDKRAKVIHKTNGGASSARNAGLDVAQGQFVAFVDSDDRIIDTDMYMRLYNRIIETNSDICVSGYKEIYSGYKRTVKVPLNGKVSQIQLWELFIDNPRQYASVFFVPWNKLFRMSLLQSGNNAISPIRFNEELSSSNDVWFTSECASASTKGVTFVDFIPYAFMIKNNPTSISKTGQQENRRKVLTHLEGIMLAALPQRANDIRQAIQRQNYINATLYHHLALINKQKPENKLKWNTITSIQRYSKNPIEKISALLMFLLPGVLYRMAFRLYCMFV